LELSKDEAWTGGRSSQTSKVMTFGGVIAKGPNPNFDMNVSYLSV